MELDIINLCKTVHKELDSFLKSFNIEYEILDWDESRKLAFYWHESVPLNNESVNYVVEKLLFDVHSKIKYQLLKEIYYNDIRVNDIDDLYKKINSYIKSLFLTPELYYEHTKNYERWESLNSLGCDIYMINWEPMRRLGCDICNYDTLNLLSEHKKGRKLKIRIGNLRFEDNILLIEYNYSCYE